MKKLLFALTFAVALAACGPVADAPIDDPATPTTVTTTFALDALNARSWTGQARVIVTCPGLSAIEYVSAESSFVDFGGTYQISAPSAGLSCGVPVRQGLGLVLSQPPRALWPVKTGTFFQLWSNTNGAVGTCNFQGVRYASLMGSWTLYQAASSIPPVQWVLGATFTDYGPCTYVVSATLQ